MARSSRHKLHRSHKHRDRSESDDEGISKERKQKTEEEETVRVSRGSDQEKRRNSSKDVTLSSNGDVTSEHGKKRKDIGDRWNGGGDKDVKIDKEIKRDDLIVKSERSEKSSKGKYISTASKNRDDTSERIEEKKKMDKESGSSLYKDGKEMEKVREKDKLTGKEMEKKERGATHEVEVSEDREVEKEKEKEKRYKRRDESGDYDKVDDSKEDHSKYRSHKDGKGKDKYRDELDREHRHYDDKRRRDERSSRTHTSEKSDKYNRDETKVSESHDKKSKFRDSEYGNHSSKHKDSRGRKRSSDEIGDENDMKTRSAKEPRDDTVKYGSSSSRYDSRSDRPKVEQSDMEKADSSLSSIRPKISPKSVHDIKDQKRDKSGKIESSQRESLSVDVQQSSSVVHERISEVKSSEKMRPKDTSHSDISMEDADQTLQSDSRTSLNQLSEKSSFINERQPEDGGQKSHNTLPPNKFNNSPSVLRSYEDEIRNQNNGDRRVNNRYKRGPGTPWKGSGPTWPSPVPNGFMPMQHGPTLGFPHPTVPQFPSQSLYGVRPPMELINSQYNNLHVHPYDMQMWDGNPNMFGEEPHMFGRQEWDQNRMLMGNRGWEMNKDNNIWNGQNGNMNMEYNVTQKETEYSHDEHAKSEKHVADDGGSKISRNESPVEKEVSHLSKSVAEKTPQDSKMPSPQTTPETKSDTRVSYVSYYVSKLDISAELAHADVYNQCMYLVEGNDGKRTSHSVDMGGTSHSVSMGQRKNNLNDFMPVAKSRQSLLPKPSEATFQKAMSLYSTKMERSKSFKPKAEGKKEITSDAQVVNNIVKNIDKNLKELDNNNGADGNCDMEISEKTENIVINPESFGVNISRILSSESTH